MFNLDAARSVAATRPVSEGLPGYVEQMADEIDRLRLADDILQRIAATAEQCDGDQAHRILPNLWPLICEAHKHYIGEP